MKRHTERLKFHRFPPEFGFDANVLPKFEIGRRCVAGTDWWMVTHLIIIVEGEKSNHL